MDPAATTMPIQASMTEESSPHAPNEGMRAFVTYSIDIIWMASRFLKLPLALLLSLCAMTCLFLASGSLVMQALKSSIPSVPSLCHLPGMAILPFCDDILPYHDSEPFSSLRRADYPSLVNIQNVVLDKLVEQSASGRDIALNVKHAEFAVKDLVVVVRSSNLSIKDALADSLTDFAMDARAAARGLQRLSARIHGAVDSISSFNAYALRSIESAKLKGGSEVSSAVLRSFRATMNGFSAQLTSVVVEVAITTASLDLLEDRLSTIQSLATQESIVTNAALDDLLWELWTIFGGNQSAVRDLRSRMQVLKEVGHYRAVAAAYVAAASHTLQAVDAQLTELRDRLTEYVVQPGSLEIPVEVHVASIERGMSRIQEKLRSSSTDVVV